MEVRRRRRNVAPDKTAESQERSPFFQSFKDRIQEALALQNRHEVRSDGLMLESLCDRLEICWGARDVHPWDQGFSFEYREATFFRQLMEDTEAAIIRIFEQLPEIDVIEVKVFGLQSDKLLLSGTVLRSSLTNSQDRIFSVRMRLASLGLQCHFSVESTYSASATDA
jgi:hypothetical protein